jgi:hypothetical protein
MREKDIRVFKNVESQWHRTAISSETPKVDITWPFHVMLLMANKLPSWHYPNSRHACKESSTMENLLTLALSSEEGF